MMIVIPLLMLGLGLAIIGINVVMWIGGVTVALYRFLDQMLCVLGMKPLAVGLRWILALFVLAVGGGTVMLHNGKDPHNFMALCVGLSVVAAGSAIVWQIVYWSHLVNEGWREWRRRPEPVWEVNEPTQAKSREFKSRELPCHTLRQNSRGVYVPR